MHVPESVDRYSPFVFDVQRFCLHDGPGIRAVVFFKGCPLRCQWCQNPESLDREPELAFYPERCSGCLSCQTACSNDAILFQPSRVDREKCQACGRCAEVCPHEALRLIGEKQPVERLLEIILADKQYFKASGGGVTLSGGEPLFQADAAVALLKGCNRLGISTMVETCGLASEKTVLRAMPFTDRFYFDLKAFDQTLHKELTGQSSDRIIRNARKLAEAGADVVFRMPIIPGKNDSEKNYREIAAFVQSLGQDSLCLLKYHSGGEAKLSRLHSKQDRLNISTDEVTASISRATDLFKQLGIKTTVEGSAPESEVTRTKSVFSDRVWRLRKVVQSASPAICTQRALLVTRFFKNYRKRNEPIILKKARALEYILTHKEVKIYPDELLVGCFSSKRVGGSILPELHGTAMLLDLFSFTDRKVNPLQLAKKDRRDLALKVLPYWGFRSLAAQAFRPLKAVAFIFDQLAGKRFLINESGGISHIVPDYAKLLFLGASGIARQAAESEKTTGDPAKRAFYQSVQISCAALTKLAAPYEKLADQLALAEDDPARRSELLQIAKVCRQVPESPAGTMQEALQSILFTQIALNQESLDNSVCPGRLDQVLYPYYLADVEAGRIDEQKARDLIGCFTVKMCEIVPVFSRRVTRFHGGMFNGQVVVVGGTDEQGNDATNELTWMFLDAMEHLRMRQPNYHARIHKSSPVEYLNRISAMLLDGSGAPSLMNDEVIVPLLEGRGIEKKDARNYSPVGCIEPVACGKTFGSTDAALVNIGLCLEWALGTKPGGAKTKPLAECRSIDEVVELFQIQIEQLVKKLIDDLQAIEKANAKFHPTPLTSMLLEGCLESGVDSTAGGVKYNASGVQAVGVADVADSLAAIEQVVFKQGVCNLRTLQAVLRANFSGYEDLHGHLLKAPKFDNDESTVDRLADLVMTIFAKTLAQYENTRGGAYLAGFYSVTAHSAFGETTGALPSGRKNGRPLANGLSPSNGLDRKGPTACLNSAAGLDLIGSARNGVNVNLKIDGGSLAGEKGQQAMTGLVRGYFAKGGMQTQINVMDPKVLLEARDNPASHPWLLVRVSGYSAYFNDLSPEMKQELIDRSLHQSR